MAGVPIVLENLLPVDRALRARRQSVGEPFAAEFVRFGLRQGLSDPDSGEQRIKTGAGPRGTSAVEQPRRGQFTRRRYPWP